MLIILYLGYLVDLKCSADSPSNIQGEGGSDLVTMSLIEFLFFVVFFLTLCLDADKSLACLT